MNWTDSSRRGTGVGLRVMRHLLRTFEDHVGPQAQVLLEAELRRVGATPEDLDAARFADLIRAAARHVPDPERRKKFVNEVLGDTRRRR